MDSKNKAIEEFRALIASQPQVETMTSRIGELELQLAIAKRGMSTPFEPPADRSGERVGLRL